MLIKCPECNLNVSDKAISCPHCGYPLKKDLVTKKCRSTKRKRLPNGFGYITEIKDKNLRNPFRAMVTVGKNENGRPIAKLLKPQAYFKTYNEAYEALVEYNKNPYDLDDDMSVAELYEKWSATYFQNIKASAKRTVTSAWGYCASIYDMRAKDVRVRHIKGCIEEGFRIETVGKNKGQKVYPSDITKSKIKSLFNLMFDYAVEYEIVDKNYARDFSFSKSGSDTPVNQQAHIIFTEEELKILWENIDKPYVDWILIQCYMGWRPQELCLLRLDEINLDSAYMCSGMKTDAGKQRIVPIHSKIYNLVKKNYEHAKDLGSEYLIVDYGKTHKSSLNMTYDKYRTRFNKVITWLNLNPAHKPHDPRMTFITRCKKAGTDEFALKEMVGHTIEDITESVYTVRDLDWLRTDLEKMH